MRASRVIATFISTSGRRLCWIQCANPSLEAPRLSVAGARRRLRRPGGSADASRPWPATSGLGSIVAATTRADKPRLDQRVGAGRCAASVIARFERDVSCAAPNSVASAFGGCAQRDDFGVIDEVVFVPSFAGKLAGGVENDAADGGIGRGDSDAFARELKGAPHPIKVPVGNLICAGHLIPTMIPQIP